jgi:hypothetical protein
MRTPAASLYFPSLFLLFSDLCLQSSGFRVFSVFRGKSFPLHLGKKRARSSIKALSRFLRDAQSCGFCVRHSTRLHSGYLIAADGTTGPKIHIIALAPQAPRRGDVAAQKELFRSLKRFTVLSGDPSELFPVNRFKLAPQILF